VLNWFTRIQKLQSVNMSEQNDQFCNHGRPPGLMAGPKARTVVAVEVLEEQDLILPLGIGLELLRTSVHGPPARNFRIRRSAISLATSNRSCRCLRSRVVLGETA
jgi:hypothetical protein